MKAAIIKELQSLFEPSVRRHYKKGHIFLLPGDLSEYTYFLLDGKVKVYDVTYRGDEFMINSFTAPSVFPLSMVFTDIHTRYIYEAASDVVVQQVVKEEVFHFLKSHGLVVLELMKHLYEGVDKLLERMSYSIIGTAKVRLIYAIVNECREFGGRYRDEAYVIHISEKELGYRTGLSRETINREMKLLKIRKLIQVKYGEIVVPNIVKLEAYL